MHPPAGWPLLSCACFYFRRRGLRRVSVSLLIVVIFSASPQCLRPHAQPCRWLSPTALEAKGDSGLLFLYVFCELSQIVFDLCTMLKTRVDPSDGFVHKGVPSTPNTNLYCQLCWRLQSIGRHTEAQAAQAVGQGTVVRDSPGWS